MNTILVVLLSLVYAPNYINSLADSPATERTVVIKNRCAYDRVYRLMSYDCSNMNLKEVPQDLRSSVEVFDLSLNRIRRLNEKSFARYSDIKLLYLFDNVLISIEDGTFSHLTNLEAIDLSNNALTTISLELFKLPRLRNLYYNDNELIHIKTEFAKLERPVVAPLQKISIANCQLSSIPDFGILPELIYLNVSLNKFNELTAQQFSPFCSLIQIVIENATEMSICTCKSLKKYFEQRQFKILDVFDCPTEHEEEVYCTSSNDTVDSPEFDQCMGLVQKRISEERSKKTWLWIMVGLGAFFVTFILTLYLFHRRNVRRAELLEKNSTKLRHIHQTANGNVEVMLPRQT